MVMDRVSVEIEFVAGWVLRMQLSQQQGLGANDEGVRTPHGHRYVHTHLNIAGCRITYLQHPIDVTEFVPLHDIPYILLSPDRAPYLSIEEFLASLDQYQDPSVFVPDSSSF